MNDLDLCFRLQVVSRSCQPLLTFYVEYFGNHLGFKGPPIAIRGIEWSRGRCHVTLKGQTRDPNTFRVQFLENSWRCYLATIANYYLVCCEAVRSDILATAWLLVLISSSGSYGDAGGGIGTNIHDTRREEVFWTHYMLASLQRKLICLRNYMQNVSRITFPTCSLCRFVGVCYVYAVAYSW